MAMTLTTAAERDAARATTRSAITRSELALGATSALAAILIVIAYAGAVRAQRSVLPVSGPIVNVNTVADVATIERVLEPVFAASGDRRLAARELFTFLLQFDEGRRRFANIGAIARARVSAAAIERTALAPSYRERLAEERARARTAGQDPPASLSLFTSAQMAQIKPSLVVRNRSTVRTLLILWGVLYIAAFHVVSVGWRVRRVPGDRMLLTAAHVLTALGFAAMVSRPDGLRDTLLFVRYAQGVIAGLTVAGLVAMVKLRNSPVSDLSYVPLIGAFALSVLLLSPLGSGPAGSNAKVNLGPFQPIELIRILLALFLAGYFSRNWELLRAVRSSGIGTLALPAWINLPRARYVVPVVLGVACALALFFGQRDLGPALILAVVFLAAYGVARGTVGLMLAGAALLAVGFYVGYRLEISSTLADRMRMWQAPWDNVVHGGDQVARALWSMSAGAWSGAGPGLGDTRYLPAGHTDLVLAALAEELGFAGVILVALVYAAIVTRALSIARAASTDFGFFLATILALTLSVPVLLMAAGTLGVVPLTGVVTPFLSYGGSAMVANFAALGLLAAIRCDGARRDDFTIFRMPLRCLGGGLAVAAIALVLIAGRVQVTRADELLVKPYLGLQADGVRRYQYNPRILDLARRIPRGTIADRNGLPMATDDRARLTAAAPAFERLGIAVRSACPDDGVRCYPLGGLAFHVLGDAASRTNWSASNTSFMERDREARLRGFDDRSVFMPITDKDGARSAALRRDYRDLVPAFRHRFDPDHPAVKAAMSRDRELRLTIDARLQTRVAAIVGAYARRSATGRAAAVVLDVTTGDLLASVSYPWPSTSDLRQPRAAGDAELDDAFLDRARYGQYPPGSIFKLITATAAMRRDAQSGGQTFTCSRLPDGRVGARIRGYVRPVRDDIVDRAPHGTIDMHRALVVSCNAYFAQLAARLGPQALLDAATAAEITIARNDSIPRIRETLPQAGYGQGDIVTSPLKMARIAAAIASQGTLRGTRVDFDTAAPAPRELLTPGSARTLSSYMRDVILDGTGRSLRGHPVAIAGKTGTAEVDRAASHSWFVGFAPYGQATKQIAVAVILENAGYGGAGAAPAAGEIITAAGAAGLVR